MLSRHDLLVFPRRVFQRLHFSHSVPVAWGAAEVRGQKGFDQFPGQRRTDYLSTQAEDIHPVIFDALMGGENIMDERGTHTTDFVRGDGRTHAAATQRHSSFQLSRGEDFGQTDDEVWVVVSAVQLVCAEIDDLVS